jgi:hypothetical protein
MKKKLFFLTFLLFAIAAADAQVFTKPVKKQVNTVTNTPTPVQNNTSVYSLTSVRVNIRTGSDNKEFPSKVYVTLMAKGTPSNWRNYLQFNLGNEMKINSNTEFGLDLEGRPPTPLEDFQKSGLKLSISYVPNFFADAWKIESVSLVLEFKDQFGNLHPTLGNKTIVFSNAYGFLNGEYTYMECYTDASFAPLTSVIRK